MARGRRGERHARLQVQADTEFRPDSVAKPLVGLFGFGCGEVVIRHLLYLSQERRLLVRTSVRARPGAEILGPARSKVHQRRAFEDCEEIAECPAIKRTKPCEDVSGRHPGCAIQSPSAVPFICLSLPVGIREFLYEFLRPVSSVAGRLGAFFDDGLGQRSYVLVEQVVQSSEHPSARTDLLWAEDGSRRIAERFSPPAKASPSFWSMRRVYRWESVKQPCSR